MAKAFIYPFIECPEPTEGCYYFYILECADNSLYCGSSSNLKNRKKEHDSGKAAKWTKERRPTQLVYFEIYNPLIKARRRELQIKSWSRVKKEKLINGHWHKLE